jgi:hypothetical protein
MNNGSHVVYATKEMKRTAPQRHGQSAWKQVEEGQEKKLIPVIFIVSDSSETGQWIPMEIHIADKERRKAERKLLYAQRPLLLQQLIQEKKRKNRPREQTYASCTWWRNP